MFVDVVEVDDNDMFTQTNDMNLYIKWSSWNGF